MNLPGHLDLTLARLSAFRLSVWSACVFSAAFPKAGSDSMDGAGSRKEPARQHTGVDGKRGQAALCRSEHKEVLQLQLRDGTLFLKLFEIELGFVADDRDELGTALEVVCLELQHVVQAEPLDFLEAWFAGINGHLQPLPRSHRSDNLAEA